MVHHGDFYHSLRTNMNLMRDFMMRMCDVLTLFARLSIVHADLKPDNIIIDYNENT
jgi:serine/threonine protein kinase